MPSMALSNRPVYTDRPRHWSLPLVLFSRNDSTISFDGGAPPWFLNEIVRFLSEYLVSGSDQRLV